MNFVQLIKQIIQRAILMSDRRYMQIRKKAIQSDSGIKNAIRKFDEKNYPYGDRRYDYFEAFISDDLKICSLKWEDNNDCHDPIFICVVKDDLQRVQLQLNHYRHLGFSKFVYVDNNSSDGTAEWLTSQIDVNLFSVSNQFYPNKKNAWIRRITNMYGYNRWYFICDSDEFFVFPNCEKTSIKEFIGFLEKKGKKNVCSMMLDMYTQYSFDSIKDKDSVDIMSEYRWFDSDSYNATRRDWGLQITGGPRKRVFFENDSGLGLLTKYPLAKIEKNDIFNSHFYWLSQNVPDTELHSVLKHYKFLPTDYLKYKEYASSGVHSDDSAEYKAYVDGIERNRVCFHNDSSCEYVSSDDIFNINIFDSNFYKI